MFLHGDAHERDHVHRDCDRDDSYLNSFDFFAVKRNYLTEAKAFLVVLSFDA